MKKGRRATENSPGNVSSESPSTPDYDGNFPDNPTSDEISSGVDLKGLPKSKKKSGWTDEPVRSGSSGKYVLTLTYQMNNETNIYQCFFSSKGIKISQRKVNCKFKKIY